MQIIDAHAHVVQCIAGFTSRGELRASGGGKAKYADGSEFQMIPSELGETGFTPEKLMFGTDVPSNLCRDSYAHLKDYILNGGVLSPRLKKFFTIRH